MLYAGIAMYFISKDIEEVRKEFGVNDIVVEDEDALKSDLRAYLQLHRQVDWILFVFAKSQGLVMQKNHTSCNKLYSIDIHMRRLDVRAGGFCPDRPEPLLLRAALGTSNPYSSGSVRSCFTCRFGPSDVSTK